MGFLSGCLRLQSGPETTTSGQGETGTSDTTTTASQTTVPENAPESITEGWPQYMRDARNSGWAPDSTGPTDGVEEVWSFETNRNFDAAVSIASGTAYGAAWGEDVFALDVQRGRSDWTQPLDGNAAFGAPAIEDEIVVFTTHSGSVVGLNTMGGYQWQDQTDVEIWASPTIDDGSVYVSRSDGRLSAYTLERGTESWQVGIDEDAMFSTPAVSDSVAVIAGSAFRRDHPRDMGLLSSEFVRWMTEYGEGGTVYGFDVEAGERLWSRSVESPVLGSASIRGEMAYIGDHGGTMHALDLTSGAVEWSRNVDSSITSPPTVTEDRVFAGSWDGTCYAWNRRTGEREWILPTSGAIRRSPIVVGEAVYLNASGGSIFAVEKASGRTFWEYQLGTGSTSTPVMVDGMLVIGTQGKNNDDPNKPSPGEIVALA